MSNKSEATFHGTNIDALDLEPERETIGDWAGHTPREPLVHEIGLTPAVQNAIISNGIAELVYAAGRNSQDHGFHEDWPVDRIPSAVTDPAELRQLGLAIVEKLALEHEEISESLGEIRSGRGAQEIYYVDKLGQIGPVGAEYTSQYYGQPGTNRHPETVRRDGDIPLLKPEGFPIEQADLVIRAADLAYLTCNDLGKAILIKHEYNATRPFKHGRKF